MIANILRKGRRPCWPSLREWRTSNLDRLRHHLLQRTCALGIHFKLHESANASKEPCHKRAKIERAEPGSVVTASSTSVPPPITPAAPPKLASRDVEDTSALATAPEPNPKPTKEALLAGHAQGDCPTEGSQACMFEAPEQASVAEALPPPDESDDDDDDDDEENDAGWKKRYNACEAKLRRICEPKGVSGKIEADSQLVKDWQAKGHTRTQLVKLMMEADGVKDH